MESPGLSFAEHDRETIRAMAASGAVLVLPIGAIEQHGPHLPVWTDTLVVEHLALGAAALVHDQLPILVAPTMPFGSSAHHLPFGGTLSLDTTVVLDVLKGLGRSAHRSGFRRLFILNGHGGNHELVELAARDLSLELGIDVAGASWWQVAADQLAKTGAHDHGRVPGHAGAFETALISALRPDLVRAMPPVRPGPHATDAHHRPAYRLERGGFWHGIDGYSDQPGALDADLGRDVLERATVALADALRDFHRTVEGHE